MEVDEDLEAGLLRQFNCMLTTDKEVLIKELQTLVGANLNEHTARFYLEMTDWNLQAAVCAYFDLQSFNKLPQMTFVKDITIGEGESVPPSTKFIKTWRIQNTGEEGWPSGCSLVYTGGEQMGAPPRVSVAPLRAGEMADISVEMVSPGCTGYYSSKWRMTTSQGSFYGDTIWVIIQVDSGGTLALMQQMVNFKELGGCPPPTTTTHTTTTTNPFAPTNPHHPNGNLNPAIPSSPPRPIQEALLGVQGPPLTSSLPNQDEDTGLLRAWEGLGEVTSNDALEKAAAHYTLAQHHLATSFSLPPKHCIPRLRTLQEEKRCKEFITFHTLLTHSAPRTVFKCH